MKKSSKARFIPWLITILFVQGVLQIILETVVFLTIHPGAAYAQGKKKEKDLFPPNTEVLVGKSYLPDPLTPYDSLIDLKFLEKSPIKETVGCAQLEVWQPVAVETEQWNALNLGTLPAVRSEVGVLAIKASVNCVKPGHPMRIVQIRPKSGIGVELGWFFPTAIHGRRTEFQDVAGLESQLLLGARMPLDTKDVAFVSGRVISSLPRPWAPRITGARFINRQQMEAAIRGGTTVIDIRPRASFEKFRIKGSISIPYSTGPRMVFHEGYEDYPKSGDAFDVRKVPPQKDKPVVLLGSFDTADVFRAAVVLREEGWKSIFIFWEGIEYFSGMIWSPPVTSQLVRVVSAIEVANILDDKTLSPVVIDVRQNSLFSAGHIPGAYSIEFYERSDMYLRLPGLNGAMLIDYGEYSTIPEGLNTATTLIFVGIDEKHWAPYKAALIARQYGFGNAMWYRGGMAEWMRLSGVNKMAFRTRAAPSPLPKNFKGGMGL